MTSAVPCVQLAVSMLRVAAGPEKVEKLIFELLHLLFRAPHTVLNIQHSLVIRSIGLLVFRQAADVPSSFLRQDAHPTDGSAAAFRRRKCLSFNLSQMISATKWPLGATASH